MPIFQIHVTILSYGSAEGSPISNSSTVIAFDDKKQAELAIKCLSGAYAYHDRRDCECKITRLYDVHADQK